MLYKKTRAQAPSARAVERLECLVDLRYLICERFMQQGSGYLLQKCTIFMGKKFPCISQGIKKHSLLIDFSKFSKIMRHYALFSELCAQSRIMRFRIHA